MCILCVIQKWSRSIATMLPWLVIPFIGLWALSQLLPPAFRFEITSPRLACVLVLLMTLFWYEILMPQLSAWRVRRNAILRERKRFAAIEMMKLRKTATKRCRNCLTPYKDQNPGGGKFMCSYCGHISKRPVLDLPVPPGMKVSNAGILKDLVGKGGKILNGKVWSDNGWMCGQDWLENGNWVGGSIAGKSSYLTSGGRIFSGDDHCLAEKSYSRIFSFTCKVLAAFFFSIIWLWRKIFRISSSANDASMDAERRGALNKRGHNAGKYIESKGEKARRKAEEKRMARIEKELLEEEERKQREEVARLVEERRRLREEKLEAEKAHGKGSPTAKERDRKRESEKKRQERKKDTDRASSKSNSDAEELEKRVGKENERHRKYESNRRAQHKTGVDTVKAHSADVGHLYKIAAVNNHYRANTGTRYLDRMKGTILSSSRAFTGGGFFGRGANISSVSREHKTNASVDHFQTSANRRELSQPNRINENSYAAIDDNKNSISRPVLIQPQQSTTPKKSWQQLFTRSSSGSPPSNSNVISRPSGKSHAEAQSPTFQGLPPSTQAFNNPINFGLSSPFAVPSFSFGTTSNSTNLPLSSEMFPLLGERPAQFLPEESEIFEDPCYIPDPVSLLGPVSESLDLGFVGDKVFETPCAIKNMHAPSEVNKPSPIQSPLSRLRVTEERLPTSFLFPSNPEVQDACPITADGLSNANGTGTWQMWSSSPLGPDSLGLLGDPASWFMPQDLIGSKKDDSTHPVAPKTMASLFKKNDEQGLSGTRSPQKGSLGNCQNGGTFNYVPVSAEGPRLQRNLFGPVPVSENHFPSKIKEAAAQNRKIYGSPRGSATNNQFDMSTANGWAKKDWNVQGSVDGIGNSTSTRPHIGGLYSTPDVQSLWSYD